MRHWNWHKLLWVSTGFKIIAVWILSWNGWHLNNHDKCVCWQGTKNGGASEVLQEVYCLEMANSWAITNAALAVLQLICKTKNTGHTFYLVIRTTVFVCCFFFKCLLTLEFSCAHFFCCSFDNKINLTKSSLCL